MDEATRKKFGIDPKIDGVLLLERTEITERTREWMGGDVIIAVDDGDQNFDFRSVTSPGEVKAALDRAGSIGRFYITAIVARGEKSLQLHLYAGR